MFHHKHTEHAQEKECKIVDIIENASHVTENYYHLFDVPDGLISSITLGHKISLHDEDNIKNLLKITSILRMFYYLKLFRIEKQD